MPRQKVMTLSPESIEQFRKTLSGKGRSTHTVKAYCSDLTVFLSELGPDETIVSLEELEELGESWLTKNRRVLAPRTTARRLTSLRAFCNWAGHTELMQDYSAPDGGVATPHPLPEGMAGVRRMIAATFNEKQHALCALLGMVGLRLAEALSVTADNFSFQGSDCLLTVRGKGDKTRTVPVSTEAQQYLLIPIARVMGTDNPVIQMSDRFARRTITKLAEKARLSRRVASHDLRATFATAVYNKTLDKRLVQLLLGHADGRTTDGYIGIEMAKMKLEVEDL